MEYDCVVGGCEWCSGGATAGLDAELSLGCLWDGSLLVEKCCWMDVFLVEMFKIVFR